MHEGLGEGRILKRSGARSGKGYTRRKGCKKHAAKILDKNKRGGVMKLSVDSMRSPSRR